MHLRLVPTDDEGPSLLPTSSSALSSFSSFSSLPSYHHPPTNGVSSPPPSSFIKPSSTHRSITATLPYARVRRRGEPISVSTALLEAITGLNLSRVAANIKRNSERRITLARENLTNDWNANNHRPNTNGTKTSSLRPPSSTATHRRRPDSAAFTSSSSTVDIPRDSFDMTTQSKVDGPLSHSRALIRAPKPKSPSPPMPPPLNRPSPSSARHSSRTSFYPPDYTHSYQAEYSSDYHPLPYHPYRPPGADYPPPWHYANIDRQPPAVRAYPPPMPYCCVEPPWCPPPPPPWYLCQPVHAPPPTPPPPPPPPKQVAKAETKIELHTCKTCHMVRSTGYHRDHPLMPGQKPELTDCAKCKKKKQDLLHPKIIYTDDGLTTASCSKKVVITTESKHACSGPCCRPRMPAAPPIPAKKPSASPAPPPRPPAPSKKPDSPRGRRRYSSVTVAKQYSDGSESEVIIRSSSRRRQATLAAQRPPPPRPPPPPPPPAPRASSVTSEYRREVVYASSCCPVPPPPAPPPVSVSRTTNPPTVAPGSSISRVVSKAPTAASAGPRVQGVRYVTPQEAPVRHTTKRIIYVRPAGNKYDDGPAEFPERPYRRSPSPVYYSRPLSRPVTIEREWDTASQTTQASAHSVRFDDAALRHASGKNHHRLRSPPPPSPSRHRHSYSQSQGRPGLLKRLSLRHSPTRESGTRRRHHRSRSRSHERDRRSESSYDSDYYRYTRRVTRSRTPVGHHRLPPPARSLSYEEYHNETSGRPATPPASIILPHSVEPSRHHNPNIGRRAEYPAVVQRTARLPGPRVTLDDGWAYGEDSLAHGRGVSHVSFRELSRSTSVANSVESRVERTGGGRSAGDDGGEGVMAVRNKHYHGRDGVEEVQVSAFGGEKAKTDHVRWEDELSRPTSPLSSRGVESVAYTQVDDGASKRIGTNSSDSFNMEEWLSRGDEEDLWGDGNAVMLGALGPAGTLDPRIPVLTASAVKRFECSSDGW